ncbi:hypothetical protein [Hymenobacter coccineus]|uniref:DUF4148 domain-containing protein n=1 Tax=Hymenobacter coccineus TaxID=1908235 RepID=A0A1G1TKM6_9BACT|nr:hypothetical protein [Hymenobacter coccineus]OGX91433.1 hypothetical protein BEN49_19835 [Hymenobacter coccineus]
MKNLFAAVALAGLGLVAAPAFAQSGPVDPRQPSLTAEEIKHNQQMQVLEARAGIATGNTSLSRAAGPARQYDTKAGGFMVRKFKAAPGAGKAAPGAGKQERGQMHPASGANPSGKPLVHKHPGRKKRFLFF